MIRPRCALLVSILLAACKPCEDSCDEFVELSFVSVDAMGVFGSTSYDIRADAAGQAISCTFDIEAGSAACQGAATAHVDAGDGSGEDGTGGFDDGRKRLVLRWYAAPDMLDITVYDAAQKLLLSNTLTPAYQDQGVKACDEECRSFGRELSLPVM